VCACVCSEDSRKWSKLSFNAASLNLSSHQESLWTTSELLLPISQTGNIMASGGGTVGRTINSWYKVRRFESNLRWHRERIIKMTICQTTQLTKCENWDTFRSQAMSFHKRFSLFLSSSTQHNWDIKITGKNPLLSLSLLAFSAALSPSLSLSPSSPAFSLPLSSLRTNPWCFYMRERERERRVNLLCLSL